MKPDAPAAKSPVPSRDGSEAPSSPALGSAAPAPSTRPKLNLAKRTLADTPDQPSPTTSSGKSNPFGGAVAVDTAARERQVEEARIAALAEKKEAEEKAKVERAEAAKAKAAEAETQKTAEAEPKEILQRSEGEVKSAEGSQNGAAADKPTEIPSRPKPAETGAWRRPSAGPPGPRDDGPPRGPRGGRGGRGGRGDGPGRGPRHFDEGRGGRQNSNGRVSSPTVSSPAPVVEADPDAPADDGWSTVAKPKKNNRGGK